MLFSTHKMSLNHQLDDEEILTIDFNDQKVERVEQYKMLGIVIDNRFELYTQANFF